MEPNDDRLIGELHADFSLLFILLSRNVATCDLILKHLCVSENLEYVLRDRAKIGLIILFIGA